MLMAKLRKDQTILLWASAASLAIWMIPGLRLLAAPLALLNTHYHELFHAIAALASGGSVSHIVVNKDFSGLAEIRGGFMPLVASAGYVGASLWGGILIWLGGSPQRARGGLMLAGALTAISLIAFVRGDWVGVLSGLFWSIVLLAGQAALKDEAAVFAVQFLGIQQALTSFLAFVALLNVSMGYGHSDAKIMEQASGIPALIWAGAWMVLSAALVFLCLRSSWKGENKG
jgi:hypothetical protein